MHSNTLQMLLTKIECVTQRALTGKVDFDEESKECVPNTEEAVVKSQKITLCDEDFKDPYIFTYEANTKNLKDDWYSIEKAVREAHPQLKPIYSRKDETTGHVAISKFRQKRKDLEALKTLKIDGINFTFKVMEGKELKEFWRKYRDHFNSRIQERICAIKKAQDAKRAPKLI